MEHLKHACPGKIGQNLRLLFLRKIGKIFLRLFETIQQIPVMLTGQRLEQFFFALVVTIKCPCCHTHGFYDVPQGSVFVAFFQELCLGSLVDAF